MKYKYCSHCGKKIPKSTAFCPYCGQNQFSNQESKYKQNSIATNNLTHENHMHNEASIHTNNQDQGFLASHIYHIPTADFSNSRLKARRVITIGIICLTLIMIVVPLLLISSGNSQNGMDRTSAIVLMIMFGGVSGAIEYFVTHWLFNVSWIHFWKTWTIKKVIVSLVVLVIIVGGFGLIHHSVRPSNQLPSSIVNTTSNVGNGFQLVAHQNSFTYEGGPEAGDDVHVTYHVSHVSYDGSTIHVSCDRTNNDPTNTNFTFKIQNNQIVKAQQK